MAERLAGESKVSKSAPGGIRTSDSRFRNPLTFALGRPPLCVDGERNPYK
jgi:hypothetical protein